MSPVCPTTCLLRLLLNTLLLVVAIIVRSRHSTCAHIARRLVARNSNGSYSLCRALRWSRSAESHGAHLQSGVTLPCRQRTKDPFRVLFSPRHNPCHTGLWSTAVFLPACLAASKPAYTLPPLCYEGHRQDAMSIAIAVIADAAIASTETKISCIDVGHWNTGSKAPAP